MYKAVYIHNITQDDTNTLVCTLHWDCKAKWKSDVGFSLQDFLQQACAYILCLTAAYSLRSISFKNSLLYYAFNDLSYISPFF